MVGEKLSFNRQKIIEDALHIILGVIISVPVSNSIYIHIECGIDDILLGVDTQEFKPTSSLSP